MKRFTVAMMTIATAGSTLLAPTVSAQADRSRTTSPELHLMMDFDRQPGLEQIFKSTIEKPMPKQTCPGQRGDMKKQVFAKFEIVDGKSGKRSTMFEHTIGTNLATYWVYDIREVRNLNRDEFTDLVFYAGDDSSEETVILLRKKDHYKAVYAGTASLGRDSLGAVVRNSNSRVYYSTNNATRWDAEKEVFIGEGIAWVSEDCVTVRKMPEIRGEMAFSLSKNDLVELLETQGPWQKVRMDGREGWIEGRSLSGTSPTRIFPIR